MKGDLSLRKLYEELPNLDEASLRHVLVALMAVLARDERTWRRVSDEYKAFSIYDLRDEVQDDVTEGMTVLNRCLHD